MKTKTRSPRTSQARLFAAYVTTAALSLGTLVGCPGMLTPEQRALFVGGNGGDGGVATCTIGVSNVENQLIRPRCATAGCHDRGGRSGGLDLESPNMNLRLVGQRSNTCSGATLINPGTATGVFIDKLGPMPPCGERMPQGAPPLSESEMTCVRAWAATLNNNPPPDVVVPDVQMMPDVQMPRPDVVMDMGMPDMGTPPMDASDVTEPPTDMGAPDMSAPDMGTPPMDTMPPRDVMAPPDVVAPPDVPAPRDVVAPPDEMEPPADEGMPGEDAGAE